MAFVEIYQGDTRTLIFQFTNSGDGSPLNVSGFAIRGIAKENYVLPAVIDKTITGVDGNAVTGIVYFPLTSGDTYQCPGDYLFSFLVTDLYSGRSTIATDGLRILPDINFS